MFRSVKVIMAAAGMVAVGLPLLTGEADAQVVGQWNLVRPVSCDAYGYESADNSRVVTSLLVWTNAYSFVVNDMVVISTLLKFCYDGSAFYGYYSGSFAWSDFYVVPGLR